MADKPTYEELEQRVKELGKDAVRRQREKKQGAGEEQFLSLLELARDFIYILDKTGRIVQTNSTVRDDRGGVKGIVVLLGDITDRKHAEQGLRENEKRLYQEERRMELLKFANDVALKLMHELRTPLVWMSSTLSPPARLSSINALITSASGCP